MTTIYRHIIRILLLAFAVILTAGALEAQTVISADPDSKIWIEGRSNVNSWQCDAEEHQGVVEIDVRDVGQVDELTDRRVELVVHVPVRSFECGRSRMNRDLYEALKSERHSLITFELTGAERLNDGLENVGFENGGPIRLKVSGRLTVAGNTREITFGAEGYLLEEMRLRAVGSTTIRMTDFEVEPPTGLLGLIRAEDELTVHFDLRATPEEPDHFQAWGEER